MNTNELCNTEERKKGFSSHVIGFGILIYKNGLPWRQVETEEEMHAILKEED